MLSAMTNPLAGGHGGTTAFSALSSTALAVEHQPAV